MKAEFISTKNNKIIKRINYGVDSMPNRKDYITIDYITYVIVYKEWNYSEMEDKVIYKIAEARIQN